MSSSSCWFSDCSVNRFFENVKYTTFGIELAALGVERSGVGVCDSHSQSAAPVV